MRRTGCPCASTAGAAEVGFGRGVAALFSADADSTSARLPPCRIAAVRAIRCGPAEADEGGGGAVAPAGLPERAGSGSAERPDESAVLSLAGPRLRPAPTAEAEVSPDEDVPDAADPARAAAFSVARAAVVAYDEAIRRIEAVCVAVVFRRAAVRMGPAATTSSNRRATTSRGDTVRAK